MPNLETMLQECDDALLSVLAERWGVDDRRLDKDERIDALLIAMRDPARVEAVFDTLTPEQSAALQSLVSAGRRTNITMFEALYKPIRLMGAGKLRREQPHLNPQGEAEALYYAGLIAIRTDKVGSGLGKVVYIPDDLVESLPLHKTAYSHLEDDDDDELSYTASLLGEDGRIEALPDEAIAHAEPADTSIVDDLTTVLAYLRAHGGAYAPPGGLDDATREALSPHLLHEDDARLDFMIEVAISAQLLDVKERRLTVLPAARSWLDDKRPQQLRRLVDAWLTSADYRELWHVPGLQTESADGYDPASARRAILDTLRDTVPQDGWWSVGDLIDVVRSRATDFMRPGGNYDSWYIRDAVGDYLNGLQSWDAVEGATLEFTLNAPLHWLCLLDIAEDAARLTAYGRALLAGQWVNASDPDEPIRLEQDGTVIVSRRVSRYERFQLARFTSWLDPATLGGDPYLYKVDADGIRKGAQQGITPANIQTFFQAVMKNAPLPAAVTRLLEAWQAAPPATGVTLERHVILRTTSQETLDYLFNTPAFRQYFGARLGATAAIVRGDQVDALRSALGGHGITVEGLRE